MDKRLYRIQVRDAHRAGRITATAVLVAEELTRYADRAGVCWPSLETLAAGAGCCVRTVQRALAALRLTSLLSWRTRQSAWNRRESNVYRLFVAEQKVRNMDGSSAAKESTGSLAEMSDRLARALARLGGVLGIPTGQVAPWLPGS